jgi:hypothetical protein
MARLPGDDRGIRLLVDRVKELERALIELAVKPETFSWNGRVVTYVAGSKVCGVTNVAGGTVQCSFPFGYTPVAGGIGVGHEVNVITFPAGTGQASQITCRRDT